MSARHMLQLKVNGSQAGSRQAANSLCSQLQSRPRALLCPHRLLHPEVWGGGCHRACDSVLPALLCTVHWEELFLPHGTLFCRNACPLCAWVGAGPCFSNCFRLVQCVLLFGVPPVCHLARSSQLYPQSHHTAELVGDSRDVASAFCPVAHLAPALLPGCTRLGGWAGAQLGGVVGTHKGGHWVGIEQITALRILCSDPLSVTGWRMWPALVVQIDSACPCAQSSYGSVLTVHGSMVGRGAAWRGHVSQGNEASIALPDLLQGSAIQGSP